MKTIVWLTLFSVLLTISTSDAQLVRNYGLKAGYVKAEQRWNYTQQSGVHASGINPIWGLDAGAFVEFFGFPFFSLSSEVHFIQKGRTLTVIHMETADNPQGYIDLGMEDVKERFEYISIPILAKLRLDGPTITPFIAAGPSFEYLLSFPSSVVYDKFNKTEFAFMFSAGVELSLGLTSKLMAECRYSLGLTNMYKNEFVAVDNRVLVFLVGVAF
jgi:hypothetical protein